jgi:predicted PurR-regulated permease PerM
MYDLETLIEEIKNPRHIALSALVCLFCMILGFKRGAVGGLIVGIVIGMILSFSGLILINKHREKQEEMRESLIIPKIGLIEKKEKWLRKKKWRELKAENRMDIVIKIVWWIIFAFIALNILYWISPILYYLIQVSKM